MSPLPNQHLSKIALLGQSRDLNEVGCLAMWNKSGIFSNLKATCKESSNTQEIHRTNVLFKSNGLAQEWNWYTKKIIANKVLPIKSIPFQENKLVSVGLLPVTKDALRCRNWWFLFCGIHLRKVRRAWQLLPTGRTPRIRSVSLRLTKTVPFLFLGLTHFQFSECFLAAKTMTPRKHRAHLNLFIVSNCTLQINGTTRKNTSKLSK